CVVASIRTLAEASSIKSTALSDKKEKAILARDFDTAAKIREEEQKVETQIEAAAKAESKDKGEGEAILKVAHEDIAEVITISTGIPVKQLDAAESKRLVHLEEELHERVIGQDDAVVSVSKAIRRAYSGLKSPKRPIGSFMFLGPTGVGKTEL